MPKTKAMALSRTYLIGLGVVVALALVWFVAIKPHASTTPAQAPSLPGATGLANDVAKAHGAVATSQQNAQQLAAQSAAASKAGGKAAPSAATATPAAHAATPTAGAQAPGAPKAAAGAKVAAGASADRSVRVERDLVAGKIVLISIWNPRASDEQALHHELHTLNLRHGKVTLYYATPGQVASFGAITTGLSVAETPTLLIINPQGVTSKIVGFTDNGSIEQAIDDAKRTGGTGAVQTDLLTALTTGSSRAAYLKRANHFCRTPLKDATAVLGLQEPLRRQLSTVKGALGFVTAFITHLRAVPSPAADRPHLTFLFGAYDRGVQSLGRAFTSVGSGKPDLARSQVLQFQVLYDESTQGLADYGMTSCFPQNVR
jgi:hypothetical protein